MSNMYIRCTGDTYYRTFAPDSLRLETVQVYYIPIHSRLSSVPSCCFSALTFKLINFNGKPTYTSWSVLCCCTSTRADGQTGTRAHGHGYEYPADLAIFAYHTQQTRKKNNRKHNLGSYLQKIIFRSVFIYFMVRDAMQRIQMSRCVRTKPLGATREI